MNLKHSHSELFTATDSLQRLLANVPELVHSWRFLTGVIYALVQYYQMSDRCPRPEITEKEYIDETMEVLSLIKQDQNPADNWLRAFFYNAAVMRLDASYERFFKAYLPDDFEHKDGPRLYERIRERFPLSFPCIQYADSNFGKIRAEVNSLKHDPGGADSSQREQPTLLNLALTELIAFLENESVINGLLTKFSTKGIVVGRVKNRD